MNLDSSPMGREPFYTVISSELFIGEDAADAIRSYDSSAEVVVMSSLEEAEELISLRPGSVVCLIVSPRDGLAERQIASQIRVRDGALLLLVNNPNRPPETDCLTLSAELPFTNDTIRGLLDDLSEHMPMICRNP